MNNLKHKKHCQLIRIFRKCLKISVSDVAKTLMVSEEEIIAVEKGEKEDKKLAVTLIYYYYFQYTFPLFSKLETFKYFK